MARVEEGRQEREEGKKKSRLKSCLGRYSTTCTTKNLYCRRLHVVEFEFEALSSVLNG